jgi:hypothetical protein
MDKTAPPDVDALLAQALDELRALPAEKVRQVLEAARVALEGAVRGAYEAEVFSGLPPASSDLLKEVGRLVTLKNVVKAVGLILFLAKGCSDILSERTQQQAPAAPAPKAPEGSAPAAPKAPLPPMKKL